MLNLTLCPISALPCQINQIPDSSQPNNCILLLISDHRAVEVNTNRTDVSNLVEPYFILSYRLGLFSDGQSL